MVSSSEPGDADVAGNAGVGRPLVQTAVRAVGVVVLDVLDKHGFEVAALEDEHPVEAFAPDGADHALADGVGPGARTGVPMT